MITLFLAPIACATAVACMGGIGWLLARQVLRISERSVLLAAAPVVGTAALAVWLNGAGWAIGWRPAVLLAAAVGLYGCVHFVRTSRVATQADADWQGVRRWGAWVAGGSLFLALVGGIFDELWHFPLAGLMANGNEPSVLFLNPDFPLIYHYGFDLVVAFIATFGTPVPLASDILTAVLQTSIVLLAYLFLRGTGLSARRAAAATGTALFAASAAWVIRPFREWLPQVLAQTAPFHGSTVNALFLITYTKSLTIAAGLLLMGLLAMRRGWNIHHGWRGALFLVGAFAAAALSSETLFVVFAPVFGLAYLWEKQPLSRLWRVAALAAAAALVLTQGGMLTTVAQSVLHAPASGVAQGHTQLSFFWSFHHETFAAPINFASGLGALRGILELFGFIILGLLAASGWRRWSRGERALLIAAISSFFIPFAVHYNVLDRELLRFWIGTALIVNLLGAAELFRRLRHPLVAGGVAAMLMIGGVASTLLLNLPLTWQGHQPPAIISRALWLPYLRGETRLPPGAVIWAQVNPQEGVRDPHMMQVPLVFGVHVQSCQDLFGAVVRADCGAFATTPSEAALDRLRVTHLLLTDAFLAQYAAEPWMQRLTLVQAYPDTLPDQLGPFPLPGNPGGWSLFAVLPPGT